MINFTLYWRGIKESLKTFIIFAAVLTLYITVIISLYDPAAMSALDEWKDIMPGIMDMAGMGGNSADLMGFMSNYLYGFLLLIFPMVFSILAANRLMAKQVDSKAMGYLLAAPVSRVKVAFTQIKVLITGIFFMVLYCTVVELITVQIYFPGDIDIGKLLILNLGLFCLQAFIGSICFLASAIFNDTKYSIAFGAGIPVLAFVLQMIANMGGAAENFKYATFFTLFSPEKIVEGTNEAYISIAVLFIAALILYTLSIIIFRKKDLPI